MTDAVRSLRLDRLGHLALVRTWGRLGTAGSRQVLPWIVPSGAMPCSPTARGKETL